MQQPKPKVPLILFFIAVLGAVVCFLCAREQPNFWWGTLGCGVLALFFFMVALTRFLRNRSITSGLFISTTVVTVIYFVGNRVLDRALPLTYANLTAASLDTAAAQMNNGGFFTPLTLAQIGLFTIWFLLILWIIYAYVRPIKKIDLLLSQIIDAKEIKRLRVGKGKQYQNIAAKLQIIATHVQSHPVTAGKGSSPHGKVRAPKRKAPRRAARP